MKGLLDFLAQDHPDSKPFYELQEFLLSNSAVADATVLQWVKKVQELVINSHSAAGIAIFLDEAGKFLEYAASKAEQEDIYLLQSLAELASRSGKEPIMLVTILHLGLNSYAEKLPKSQQREWEKIAGRFEEIIWHHSLDQVAMLIANALDVDMQAIPTGAAQEMNALMEKTLKLGWYGYNVNASLLKELAPKLYPIDPTVLPILVRMFNTFGQNERSLFSFLLGSEDFGLQEFVLRTEGQSKYQLHDLYDYARGVFGAKLAALSFHWKAIDEAVSGHLPQDDLQLNILKTIGLINLINSDALIPSKEMVIAATSADAGPILEELHQHHRIHYRGHAGGYCIWPHSSVNIDDCYQQAITALGPMTTDIKSVLKERLSTRPIVARRHYIETGNLRYFAVNYVECADLKNAINVNFDADGLIIVPLCETEREAQEALSIIEAVDTVHRVNVLIAVPGPLQYLAEYLEEVRRWEWIERSVGELRHDKFAREEVSRQLASASLLLQRELQKAIGLTTIMADSELSWYLHGQRQAAVINNKAVMGLLADICDATYALSPRIHNELVNRRELSSAAASARLRLCERLFEYSDQPYLGMDREKHPPEMSMYLSVLQAAGFHREVNGAWELGLPDAVFDAVGCNVIPAMECIEELLSRKRNGRVQVTDLFEELQSAPYGVRTGMVPLLLAVFIVIHEQAIALYEDGSFIPRITGSNYLRLIKAPETFEIQFYPIGTLRTSLFSRLAIDLGINHTDPDHVALLDIARPLFVFMSGLPEFVMNTGTLSERTMRIRNLLRTTRDPVNLLFTDLPLACEVEDLNGEHITPEVIGEFSKRLKNAIDELRSRYPELLNSLLQSLLREFDLKGSFEENREALAKRASALAPFVTEIRLKSYCLRLADINLRPEQWAESLANLLCSMPAAKWRDRDSYKFDQELHHLTQQFLRVEATVYEKADLADDRLSVRVSLTKPDGQERDRVIHLSPSEAEAAHKLEKNLQAILEAHGQIGIAAASSVLWKMLSDNKVK